jgi:glycosyltransferase involved in cell wall biosynthesis
MAAAAHVITPSEHTRRDLITYLGVDEDKVSTVHEGCGVETRRGQSSGAPLEPPLPPDYLLHVGSFRINKNVERLIRAFGLASRARPGLTLVMAGGEGGDRSRLEALAGGLSLGDRLRFLGFVSDAQLETLYAGALALVLPSLYEGFGLTALEAMVRGCPVVASRHSSIPEVVGDAALLFDPLDVQDMADKLTRIVADDSLRGEMVESGRRRAAAFTWEDAARQTLEVYEKCARRP